MNVIALKTNQVASTNKYGIDKWQIIGLLDPLNILKFQKSCVLTSVKIGGEGRGGPNGGTSSLAVIDTCQSNKIWKGVTVGTLLMKINNYLYLK